MPPFVYQPPLGRLEILYVDADIIVINKPSGLLTVPGRDEKHHDSLASRVQSTFPSATIVHRLDMDTSGIVIMALHKNSHRHLSRQFETKSLSKEYIGLVEGVVTADSGEVDLPLRCDWPNRPLQMVDEELGKKAITRWAVEERKEDRTRLRLFPITGRSHQLRVHCLAMGHPILGDRFYADQRAQEKADRLCLHAEKLEITHPRTGERIFFTSPYDF